MAQSDIPSSTKLPEELLNYPSPVFRTKAENSSGQGMDFRALHDCMCVLPTPPARKKMR